MDLTRAGGDWMDHAQAVAWFDNVKKSRDFFLGFGYSKRKHQHGSSAKKTLFLDLFLFGDVFRIASHGKSSPLIKNHHQRETIFASRKSKKGSQRIARA